VTISLRAADGKALSTHSHGAFTLVINDKSAKDNFHLAGPGFSKATGVAFKGTVTVEGHAQGGQLHLRVGQARLAARRVQAQVATACGGSPS
jgi:hypothetical protein